MWPWYIHGPGLAVKQGVTVLNAPGTIDAGYRGEIKVPLINLDPEHTVTFHPGDRIAQLVIQRYVEARFIEAETLPGSDRAERGFGSTAVVPEAEQRRHKCQESANAGDTCFRGYLAVHTRSDTSGHTVMHG